MTELTDVMHLSTIDEINDELQEFNNMEEVMKYIVYKEDFMFTFEDYMRYIKNKFKPKMDLSFMKYFMEICEKQNEFCIHHIKLKEYGVITNIDTSAKIQRCLDQSNLIKDEHYLVSNVGHQDKCHGGSNKKEYYLTPDAFKICLGRSKNEIKYMLYYVFLEKCVYYYDKYNNIKIEKDRELERKMYEIKMEKKDNKIGKLTKKTLSRSRYIALFLYFHIQKVL
jgi:hypothetical protein